jgi:TPR repeat protein
MLGHMFETGKGVRKSRGEAVSWYKKSASQGYAHARNALSNMAAK